MSMRNRNTSYVAVGVFVTSISAAVVAVLALLGGGSGGGAPYHMFMQNVADLKYGAQVRFEGYNVGQVEAIEPMTETGRVRFRVDLRIRGDWPIPADSVARIERSNFLAAKTIDIAAGQSEWMLKPGEPIIAGRSNDMMTTMTKTAADFGVLAREQVAPLVERLNRLTTSVEGTVETDIQGLFRQVTALVDLLERRGDGITRALEHFVGELDKGGRRVNRLLSTENLDRFDRLLANTEAAAGDAAALSQDLRNSADQLNGLMVRIDQAVAENGENVSKSLTDAQYILRSVSQSVDSVLHNMEGSSRNMNEFTRMIRQNPSLLIGGRSRPEGISTVGMVDGRKAE